MSVALVGLALLMGLVTYPSRALPLLAPGIDRLPEPVLEYLRLLGPGALASLAAVNALVGTGPDGRPALQLGIEALGVLVCTGVVAWRRNLLPGLIAGVAFVAIARLLGAS